LKLLDFSNCSIEEQHLALIRYWLGWQPGEHETLFYNASFTLLDYSTGTQILVHM